MVSILVLFINVSSYAKTQFDSTDIVETINHIESKTSAPQNSCQTQDNTFKTIDEFISFVCSSSNDLEFVDALEARGASKILASSGINLSPSQFAKKMREFDKFNKSIPNIVNKAQKLTWKYQQKYKCKIKKSRFYPSEKFVFKNGHQLEFFANTHLHQINEPQKGIAAARELHKILKGISSDLVIIEGFEFGESLPCERVIRSVLTPKGIPNESEFTYIVQSAFLRGAKMIPGDKQVVLQEDRARFGLTQAELEEIHLVDILHFYYSALREGKNAPIQFAIKMHMRRHGDSISWDESKVRKVYKKLNQRELPFDPNEIYRDFTPTLFVKGAPVRGSNRAVDNQDLIRNQALLWSIETAQKLNVSTSVFFGSGHLEVLTPALRKHLLPIQKPEILQTIECP
ncbi:MAG: hypothetical protein CL678_01370 [Bdellovibrionaceae bacterium]|nr:hypothetical protein [Pseudobdellovibrionaceae bacterium]|tara:strand:+ start:989 stop:2191 length:1203 start_codon:yes stop_codon:yes gene_type:complete